MFVQVFMAASQYLFSQHTPCFGVGFGPNYKREWGSGRQGQRGLETIDQAKDMQIITCNLAWRLLHAGPQIGVILHRLSALEGSTAFGITRNPIHM